MMKLSKYSGAGNTFVILEKEELSLEEIKGLCASYFTDGLIIVKNFSMQYFNADGREAAMCGNGLRCVIKYLWDRGQKEELYTITTKAGLQRGRVEEELVKCFLQPPSKIEWDKKMIVDEKELSFDFINSGVPHVVLFMEPDHSLRLGEAIRYHEYFAPEGTNVNFITKISGNEITLRTYERGVERETLACGTGAVASALVAAKKYALQSPIGVRVHSNEILEVAFTMKNNGEYADITLKGSATCVIVVDN